MRLRVAAPPDWRRASEGVRVSSIMPPGSSSAKTAEPSCTLVLSVAVHRSGDHWVRQSSRLKTTQRDRMQPDVTGNRKRTAFRPDVAGSWPDAGTSTYKPLDPITWALIVQSAGRLDLKTKLCHPVHLQKLLHVRVVRLRQIRRRAEEDHPAFKQKYHLVGDFVHQVQVGVTTMQVRPSCFFSRRIRSLRWSLMMGSTMVLGSS